MRKILTFVSALMFSAMMTTNAGEAFVYNGLHYETMTDTHGAAACKVMKSDAYLTMTEVVIPDSAYYEAGGKMLHVNDVEADCFKNCTALQKVSFGRNLDRLMDNGAFTGCTALHYVVMDMSWTNGRCGTCPFSSTVMSQIDTLIWGDDVKIIENSYYWNYGTNLKYVHFGKLVNSISYTPYLRNCKKLETIDIDPANTNYAFVDGALYSKNAQGKYTMLYHYLQTRTNTSFTMQPCTSIYESAFEGHQYLQSVVLSEGLNYMNQSAFRNCEALTSVTFPTTLRSINSYVFQNTGLTAVNLSACSELTSIDQQAFYQCASLATVSLPEGLTYVGNNAFMETAFEKNAANWEGKFLYCGNVLLETKGAELTGDITVKDGTRVLACSSMQLMDGITSVTLPASVKYINYNAFRACGGLTTIDLRNVINISYYAFQNCTNLKTVSIGADIAGIGNGAFSGCTKLEDVYFYRPTPTPTEDPFNGLTKASINLHVPVGTAAQFTAKSTWKDLNIVEDLVVPGARYTVDGIVYKILSVDDKTAAVTWETRAYNTAAYSTLDGKITIPEKVTLGAKEFTVTEIDDYAFYYCNNMDTLSLPKSIKRIGENACYYNSDLKAVEFAANSVLEEIGASAFETSGSKLESFNIPSTVQIIGEKAFCGNAYMTTFPMPTSLKKVGKEAFLSCYKMPDFTLSEGIEEIADDAFYSCNNVTIAHIPASLQKLGSNAFHRGCTKWTIAAGSPYFELDENNVLYNKGKTVMIGAFRTNSMDTLIIPATVTEIYPYAFYNNSNLKAVTFPEGLKVIPKYAFAQTGLRKVDVRQAEELKDYAFYQCMGIDTILLGTNLKSIAGYGFAYDYGRPAVPFYLQCEAVTPPTLSNSTFTSTAMYASTKQFLVPVENVAQYRKTNYWDKLTLTGYTYWNITSEDDSKGTVTGGTGILLEGDVVTIIATAKKGYKFDQWSDGDKNASRTITVDAEHANLALEAQFAEKPINVGDIFTDETIEGVTVTYKVLTKEAGNMTLQVGPKNGFTTGDGNAISKAYNGPLTIPQTVDYLADTYTVVALGSDAFYLCKLTSLSLPSTVKTLDTRSIQECTELTSVNLPEGITVIPRYNLSYMNSLTALTLPTTLQYICSGVLNNDVKLATVENWNPSQYIRVGNNIGAMGTKYFVDNCVVVDGLKYSGDILLDRVSNFEGDTLVVKEGTRLIPYMGTNPNVKTIVFPASLAAIGNEALYNYPILESCTLKVATPPEVYRAWDSEDLTVKMTADKILDGTTPKDIKVFVPHDAVAAYKASETWNMLDIRPIGGWTVRFVDNEGKDIVDPQQVEQGALPVVPTEIAPYYTYDNMFVFDHWDAEVVAATEDVTYTAVYRAEALPEVKVHWLKADGGEEISFTKIPYGHSAEAKGAEIGAQLEAPECQQFDKWSADLSAIIAEIYVYPLWKDAAYTVTFVDGLTHENIQVIANRECHENVDAPAAPEHAGYVFKGWDSEAYKNVTSDLTITALYEELSAIDNVTSTKSATKFIQDGQLFIRRGDKIYDATGALMK